MSNESLTMSTRDEPESAVRVVTLTGPLVLRTMFEFQDCVREENPYHLILEVSGVEYMDSAGLGAILGAFASCQRRGKQLMLVGISGRIQTLLEVTHTDTFLPRFGSVEEAKRSVT